MAMLTRQESKRDTVHAVLEDLIHIEPRLEGPLQKVLLLLSVYTTPQEPAPQPLDEPVHRSTLHVYIAAYTH